MDAQRSCRLCLALALLAVAAPGAAAELVPVGPEQTVNVGPLSCPALAGAADGSYALAWQGWDPPGNDPRHLKVRVVDANDSLLEPHEIERAAGETVAPERLAATSGGFALQWLQASLTRRERRFQALDADGVPVGARFVAPELPTLSARPVDGYVAVRPTRLALQVRLLDAHGTPVSSAVSIGDRNVVLWWVEHQPNGAFVVLYWSLQRSGNLATDLGVRAVWFDRDGRLASRSVLVVPPWARRHAHALGADGTLAVTYLLASTPEAVLLRTFDGRGRPRGRPAVVLPDPAYHSLAVDGSGNVLLVWIAAAPSASELRERLFSPRGLPLGSARAVPETSPVSAGVACPIAAPAGAGWVVSWVETPGLPELRARRFAVTP